MRERFQTRKPWDTHVCTSVSHSHGRGGSEGEHGSLLSLSSRTGKPGYRRARAENVCRQASSHRAAHKPLGPSALALSGVRLRQLASLRHGGYICLGFLARNQPAGSSEHSPLLEALCRTIITPRRAYWGDLSILMASHTRSQGVKLKKGNLSCRPQPLARTGSHGYR